MTDEKMREALEKIAEHIKKPGRYDSTIDLLCSPALSTKQEGEERSRSQTAAPLPSDTQEPAALTKLRFSNADLRAGIAADPDDDLEAGAPFGRPPEVDMGTAEDAKQKLVDKIKAWRALRQPLIASAAVQKKRDAQEREMRFQLANAATLWLWHGEQAADVAVEEQDKPSAVCTPHSVRSQALEEAADEIAAQLAELVECAERDLKMNRDEEPGGHWSLRTANCFLPARDALARYRALIPLPAPDGGSAAAAAPFVPAEHLFLLRWLGENDFSQYGECYGKSLDALVALGLAQIHDGDEHQSSFIAKGRGGMYRAVFLTDAGRGALKQVADVAAEGQGGAVIGVANTPLPAPDAGWRDAQALEAAHRLIAFHERCKGHVSHASAADALTVARAYVALPAPPVGGSAS